MIETDSRESLFDFDLQGFAGLEDNLARYELRLLRILAKEL